MQQTDGRAVSGGRVVAVLVALAGLLAGTIMLEARSLLNSKPSSGSQIKEGRPLEIAAILPASPWPSTADVTSDGRSLFIAKISSAPTEPTLLEPETPLEQLSLMAVVVAPNTEIAILKGLQSGQIEQCEEGSIVGGWTVLAIEENHVLLEGGGQRTALYLSDSQPQTPN